MSSSRDINTWLEAVTRAPPLPVLEQTLPPDVPPGLLSERFKTKTATASQSGTAGSLVDPTDSANPSISWLPFTTPVHESDYDELTIGSEVEALLRSHPSCAFFDNEADCKVQHLRFPQVGSPLHKLRMSLSLVRFGPVTLPDSSFSRYHTYLVRYARPIDPESKREVVARLKGELSTMEYIRRVNIFATNASVRASTRFPPAISEVTIPVPTVVDFNIGTGSDGVEPIPYFIIMELNSASESIRPLVACERLAKSAMPDDGGYSEPFTLLGVASVVACRALAKQIARYQLLLYHIGQLPADDLAKAGLRFHSEGRVGGDSSQPLFGSVFLDNFENYIRDCATGASSERNGAGLRACKGKWRLRTPIPKIDEVLDLGEKPERSQGPYRNIWEWSIARLKRVKRLVSYMQRKAQENLERVPDFQTDDNSDDDMDSISGDYDGFEEVYDDPSAGFRFESMFDPDIGDLEEPAILQLPARLQLDTSNSGTGGMDGMTFLGGIVTLEAELSAWKQLQPVLDRLESVISDLRQLAKSLNLTSDEAADRPSSRGTIQPFGGWDDGTLLIDTKNNKIVAVVDWQCASTVPSWRLGLPPTIFHGPTIPSPDEILNKSTVAGTRRLQMQALQTKLRKAYNATLATFFQSNGISKSKVHHFSFFVGINLETYPGNHIMSWSSEPWDIIFARDVDLFLVACEGAVQRGRPHGPGYLEGYIAHTQIRKHVEDWLTMIEKHLAQVRARSIDSHSESMIHRSYEAFLAKMFCKQPAGLPLNDEPV
ncbi:hypothetical protein BJ508DRAFT_341629 [Ascobolus immersus RN42]|uniref:Uncharacterized protein n=1 Tax=Ascobolus immersus RN42 TaxID=1160509 RepID=A0A3N4HMB8_ASCIM|nr:hypothetical protein BJ508DRAFT_341629 [Ascobolus immersus RN42]